jgi:hypothetical protein
MLVAHIASLDDSHFSTYYKFKINTLTCARPSIGAVAECHAVRSPQPAGNVTSSNTAAAAAAAQDCMHANNPAHRTVQGLLSALCTL